MKLNLLVFIVLVSWLAAGCRTKMRDYGYRKPYDFSTTKVRKYKFHNTDFRKAYDEARATGTQGEAIAKSERNAILGELMYVIETEHGDYERRMRFDHTAWGIITDFALLGLTGATAVTGGAETKAILGAIATGVKGAELSVNKRLFQDQAIEAIQAEMRAAQAKKKAEIIDRMRQSTGIYTLELGLADIVQFYHEGTLTRAFQNLVGDAKDKEKEQKAKVAEALTR